MAGIGVGNLLVPISASYLTLPPAEVRRYDPTYCVCLTSIAPLWRL